MEDHGSRGLPQVQNRSKAMGMIGAAFGLGFTIGPFLGYFFIQIGNQLGDSVPFGNHFAAIMASVICLVNFVFAYFYLQESLEIKPQSEEKKLSSRYGEYGNTFISIR